MKKLVLIPITLTTLTPMVSMVGCNNQKATDEIIVDDFVYNTDIGAPEKYMNLEKNKKYCFVIEAKDYLTPDLNIMLRLSFYNSVERELISLPFIGGLSVEIDDDYLEFYGYNANPSALENGYCYAAGSGLKNNISNIFWESNRISQNSIIKIHYSNYENVNNAWIVSGKAI